MNYDFLKNNIHFFEKNKINILRYWLSDKDTLRIIQKYKIDKKIFVKDYALGILEYYIAVVKGSSQIGDCPTIDKFLDFLHNKNIKPSELFSICVAFKNSLIEYTYDLKIANLQLEKEINYIYEKNFSGVLDKYYKSLRDMKSELVKSSDIIDKYIIRSASDTRGIITMASEAFCKISGYTEDELIGSAHCILRHPDMKSEVFEDLWKTIQSGKIWKGEIKNKKKDGSFYWVDAVISPLFDKENKIIGFEAIRQDITLKKELEEQQSILVEQSKSAAMGEMISMIAHQWRQPLQAVSILSQKLPLNKMVEGDISDELLNEVVDGISSQLEYMSKTIDDFRDFFLPDKPKEKISIEDLINKALDFLQYMMKNDSIKINLDLQCKEEIIVHVNEIIQVLINILKNSRDVIIEKNIKDAEINISCNEEPNYIVIEIEDNAKGVPEELLDKIFEPYFSTKSNKNGTGLGLYMCKTIIEKHSSGFLSVKNSKKGAVFTIKLPLCQRP